MFIKALAVFDRECMNHNLFSSEIYKKIHSRCKYRTVKTDQSLCFTKACTSIGTDFLWHPSTAASLPEPPPHPHPHTHRKTGWRYYWSSVGVAEIILYSYCVIIRIDGRYIFVSAPSPRRKTIQRELSFILKLKMTPRKYISTNNWPPRIQMIP